MKSFVLATLDPIAVPEEIMDACYRSSSPSVKLYNGSDALMIDPWAINRTNDTSFLSTRMYNPYKRIVSGAPAIAAMWPIDEPISSVLRDVWQPKRW